MLPAPERLAADLRMLRMLWLTITLGVVASAGAFAYLVSIGAVAGGALPAGLPFYIAAGASVASIVAAFAFQKRLTERVLPGATTYDDAARAIRIHFIVSLALMEGGAILGGVMALLSNDLTPLAFVVPYFGFAFLVFPSDGRYAFWMACAPRVMRGPR